MTLGQRFSGALFPQWIAAWDDRGKWQEVNRGICGASDNASNHQPMMPEK